MGNTIQQQIFQAMADPDFYPHEVSRIRQVDTHISKVFLTGEYVYKIKRPVDLGFLDFSTLEKRRYYCDREILLNRRLTNDVYLDIITITLDNGAYAIGGTGETVEYAVRMRQLPESRTMQNLVASREINQSDIASLGRILGQFYLQTPQNESLRPKDGWKNIFDACKENFRQTESCSGTLFDKEIWETVKGATLSFLKSRQAYFFQRFKTGKIRDCHGDLRTGHIFFTDHGIQIIDCIEFNDRFRHIDVLSDLAFLLMDLDSQGEPGYGDCLLNEFIRLTNDIKAFPLLAFYKCYRAFVRCKVNCILLQSQDLQQQERKKIHHEALKYFDLAFRYVRQFFQPAIWVVCGMPATGKSTIAKTLSEILEIKVFRSDAVRKEMFGLQTHDSGLALAGEKLYSASAGSLTYNKLLYLAQQEIENGVSVILDATFSEEKYRRDVINLAKDKGITPIFIECTAEDVIMQDRLLQREFHPSVSDARIELFEALKTRYEPFRHYGDALHICVDTACSLDESVRRILIKAFRIH